MTIIKTKGSVHLHYEDGYYWVTSTGAHGGTSARRTKKSDALKFFKRECTRQN